jgi:hypothetical protein
MSMVSNKPIQLLGFGVALSIVGLGVALLSAAVTVRGLAAKSWPTTEARVVRSDVVVTKKASGIVRRAAAWSDYYTARIEYEYEVGGKSFVGKGIGIQTASEGFDPRVADGIVAKYPLGAKITISYNPRTPDFAVIDPTVSVGLWCLGIVLGFLVLIAGAILWIKAIRLDEAEKAAAQVATAPTVARPRLQGVVAASVRNVPVQNGPVHDGAVQSTRIETVEVRMHWLLRTLAVTAGLVFFFLGSLCLPLCVKMGVPANANGAPAAAGIIAYAIVLGIVGGMLLLGAFLVRKGMRRSRRVKLPSHQAASPTAQAGMEPSQPASLPDFGAFIAKCGPQEAGLTNYLVFGTIALLVGVGCFLAPDLILRPKPADAAAVKGFLWLFGALTSLAGLGMMWKPLFGQNQEILLYERGLVERVGAISYGIALDEIEQLRVQEWYDNRFAPRTFNVRAKVRGERELKFSSALRGESDRIIAYLAEHVENTEMVPFQA